jgi:hypothetical protein
MWACHAQLLYALRAGHPPNGLMAIWGVARPQGGHPAAVFFPLGYPFPYGPDNSQYPLSLISRLCRRRRRRRLVIYVVVIVVVVGG